MTIESIAFAWVAVFSLALTLIGIASYKRSRNPKLALLALGFLVLFIKALLLAISLFMDVFSDSTLWLLVAVLDAVAVMLFFGGIYKR